MSYDVDAGKDWHNITSNLGKFFNDFGVYPPDWDGKPRREVADQIDLALQSISANRLETLKAEYDSPNGWGKVENGIKFLEKVRDSCRYELPEEVRVWW